VRAIVFLIQVGLVGAVIGGAIGGFLGRLTGGGATGDHVDRHNVTRPGVRIVFVLFGAVPCAVVGWFLGVLLGNIATHGCQEMDCLSGLLWSVGGVFFGAIVGGALGAVSVRRVRRVPESGSHPRS